MNLNLCRGALVVLVLIAGSAKAQPLNIIFYGNSFTFGAGSSRPVDSLVRDLATIAGHDRPFTISAAVSGQDLEWHVANNTNRITTSIAPGNNWDFIVMQEHSTKLTRAYDGQPAFPASIDESKTTAVQLHNIAKQHSPGVKPVLYETWARGPGHAFYSGANPLFTGPDEMQTEIRAGYDMLQVALDDAAGGDVTLLAPVGDAWKEADFDNLHAGDLWHAQNRGTLLAALVIYGTIYGDYNTSDLDLTDRQLLSSLNLTVADGAFLTAAADATLRAENVPEPCAATVTIGIMLIGASSRRAECLRRR
ncbi:hypothetical protein [Bythopirellula polymerisocia]|uniref:PEP-CTERM sorting domain-containing protein n=1 Tax=Bythopirellula polymerisocia TaxID=2528003 RepID=A0A5C6D2S3_9BACT|nr:hypothetical protein [Bythopirellula polymerisocia]TWU30425.1 hypothetical protein Pla144_12110 [Bythopirellula polymerisocia]